MRKYYYRFYLSNSKGFPLTYIDVEAYNYQEAKILAQAEAIKAGWNSVKIVSHRCANFPFEPEIQSIEQAMKDCTVISIYPIYGVSYRVLCPIKPENPQDIEDWINKNIQNVETYEIERLN